MSQYRTCWETKPLLKEWIQSVPNDSSKAYCKACNVKLYAHRYSVLKHTSTKKHQDNYEKMLRQTQSSPILLNQTESQQFCQLTNSQEHSSEKMHVPDTDEAEDNTMQECLLEESIIEGDALVYNESVDVFITTTLKDNQHLELENNDDFDESGADTQQVYTENVEETTDVMIDKDELETCLKCTKLLIKSKNTKMNNGWERIRLRIETKEKMTESPEARTISSHILDTSLGKAAANVEVNIYRLEENQWQLLNQTATNDDGRCSQLVSLAEFKTGIYKLHFNVRPYFAAQNVQSFYPFIEVVVECRQGEHYHVPLLLNPFGYSTYRGT